MLDNSRAIRTPSDHANIGRNFRLGRELIARFSF
jgi:hypothetical protein